jgi:hypothetical protein
MENNGMSDLSCFKVAAKRPRYMTNAQPCKQQVIEVVTQPIQKQDAADDTEGK